MDCQDIISLHDYVVNLNVVRYVGNEINKE